MRARADMGRLKQIVLRYLVKCIASPVCFDRMFVKWFQFKGSDKNKEVTIQVKGVTDHVTPVNSHWRRWQIEGDRVAC